MDLALTDKTFIVTGGTSGLGLATARALTAEGAHTIINSRDTDRVQETVATLRGSSSGVAGSLGDAATVEALLAAASDRPSLDGALISVGGPPPGTVLSTSLEKWEEAFTTIYLGTLRLIRELVPALSAGAAIGVVLSSSVKQPIPGLSISNGLRPGLAMMIKDLADEIGPKGLRIFGLMPGLIATPRIQQLQNAGSDHSGIPLRRIGEPREFGDAAAFLLSPRASYITGSVIPIDGGALRSL